MNENVTSEQRPERGGTESANRLTRRQHSRSLVLVPLLSLLAFAVVVGPGAMSSRSVASASDQVALRAARAKARDAHPDSAFGFATVALTPDSLNGMMQQDLAVNSRYLAWLKGTKGDAAAQAFSAGVSAPYQRRIDAMRSRGVESEDVTIPTVTVWGSLTFSTRSYDPSLGPMDPVSMLFVGEASPDRVYSNMVNPAACDAAESCTTPAFQDDKGFDLRTGAFQCPSSTQWVLMGNGTEGLQWQPSVRGVMRAGDRCSSGQRQHMRIFGGRANAVFGAWSVGTPHEEMWMNGPNRYGHQVQSWMSARDTVSGFWQSAACLQSDPDDGCTAPRLSPGSAVDFTGDLSTGNGGVYQNIPFDGDTKAFEICSCS